MFATLRSIILGAALALAALVPAMAAGFDAAQRSEIEKIIREYLIANPQVLQDVMMELEKRQAAMDSQRQQSAVARTPRNCSRRRVTSWSAIRRATSRWSSSSTTTAATANAPWTT